MTSDRIAKAFAYYRTSSATNVGADKDSLMRQQSAVETYAYANGIEIVRAFYDAAVSGSDPIAERKGFAEMLEAIAANGVRAILVETANRFARDLIIQETGWKFLTSQGVKLVAVDSPKAFLDDTPTAVLVRQILGAFAEFEKASLVAKLAAARRRTGRLGGRRGLLETRPVVASRVVELRLAHPDLSLRGLSGLLEAEGFLTPSGELYGPSTLASILEQHARKRI
jgi:DNA invertase Pin-like site-specific DNA recombinase